MGYVIVYICDGKNPRCKDSIACNHPNYCHKTVDERYAKYGKCEGNPEWYPERFFRWEEEKDGKIVWEEKDHC